jgi:hypothetical protein
MKFQGVEAPWEEMIPQIAKKDSRAGRQFDKKTQERFGLRQPCNRPYERHFLILDAGGAFGIAGRALNEPQFTVFLGVLGGISRRPQRQKSFYRRVRKGNAAENAEDDPSLSQRPETIYNHGLGSLPQSSQ